MPYKNLPKRLWSKMEKCTAELKKKGYKGKSIYAICYTSITRKSRKRRKKRKRK